MREEAFSPDPPRKRNSCKAVVFDGDTVLLTRNGDRMGDFYLLPGGGQRMGETLHAAVRRETAEETGWLVNPGRLLLVRDYIGAHHEFAGEDGDVHQVELMFAAELLERWGRPDDAILLASHVLAHDSTTELVRKRARGLLERTGAEAAEVDPKVMMDDLMEMLDGTGGK